MEKPMESLPPLIDDPESRPRVETETESDSERETVTVTHLPPPAYEELGPTPTAPAMHRSRGPTNGGDIGSARGHGPGSGSNPNGRLTPNYGSISPHWPGGGESSSYQYEEFFGGTIQCPSCRGAGRIPRERENELVALIPLSDTRLKPRRTKLYVTLAVTICVVIGGLLLFFLLPRSVTLNSDNPTLTPTMRSANQTEKRVFLSVTNVFNVSNHNFFNIEVEEMDVQVLYDMRVLSTTTNTTNMYIPLRETRPYYVQVNMTFTHVEDFVVQYCAGKFPFPHTLLLPFQVTMTSKSLGRSEQTTLTSYQHVICSQLSAN